MDDACSGAIHEGFDLDGDGCTICLGDCADTDPLVYYAPIEVTSLLLGSAGPAELAWDEEGSFVGPGTVYDLASGALSGVPGMDFSAAQCLGSTGAAFYSDTRPDPATGSGYWYLARARISCGAGTYGDGQGGSQRIVSACP